MHLTLLILARFYKGKSISVIFIQYADSLVSTQVISFLSSLEPFKAPKV